MRLNRSLAVLSLSLLLLLSLNGCQDAPIPKWDPSQHGGLWVGSAKDFGLVRKQAQQICRADQACINDFVAFRMAGFISFYETYVLGCEKWKASTPDGKPITMEMVSQAVARLKAEGQRDMEAVESDKNGQ